MPTRWVLLGTLNDKGAEGTRSAVHPFVNHRHRRGDCYAIFALYSFIHCRTCLWYSPLSFSVGGAYLLMRPW